MKIRYAFACAAWLFGCVLSAHADKAFAANLTVPDAVTHHVLVVHGTRLAYTARAGTIAVEDGAERPQATMFYTAYTLDGAATSRRPVTFLFNGGPGSSTLWLRMGSFGPVRIDVGEHAPSSAPFRFVDNQYTLLDRSDLVFVDMAGSGFGRILPGASVKEIFGSDNDVRLFAQFVERYVTVNKRWNSPKFIFGESYGTPRAAMLVDALQNDGVGVNGVVLLSSIINFELASPDTAGGANTDDWQYVFALPTEAAIAWHFKMVPGAAPTIEAFERDVQSFAMNEYRDALAQGAQLAPQRYDAIVAKLHRYLGLSASYIRNADLRVLPSRFQAELHRNAGKGLGAYDGRYEVSSFDRLEDSPSLEATTAAITAPFVSTANQYMRGDLEYTTPLLYRNNIYDLIGRSGGWDYTHRGNLPLNAAPDLAEAMSSNPNLRVFSANGYYDLVTPFFATVYTLNHLNLAPQLQAHITYGFYPAGHMVYTNPTALAAFHNDLERWYTRTLAGRSGG